MARHIRRGDPLLAVKARPFCAQQDAWRRINRRPNVLG